MVTIRLARCGAKKAPFFNIVVTDSRKRRDSGYLERLGYFNPRATESETYIQINQERIDYWVSQGAQISDRVKSLTEKADKPRVRRRKKRKSSAAAPSVDAALDKAAEKAMKADQEQGAPKAAEAQAAPEAEAATEAPAAKAPADTPETESTEAEAAPEAEAKPEAEAEAAPAPEASAEAPATEAEAATPEAESEAPESSQEDTGKDGGEDSEQEKTT